MVTGYGRRNGGHAVCCAGYNLQNKFFFESSKLMKKPDSGACLLV
jgi:hypothetical protein